MNLLVATNVAEEGLDIQTCCLVVRFDLPETVASFIQSRGRARMQKSEYVFLVERCFSIQMHLLLSLILFYLLIHLLFFLPFFFDVKYLRGNLHDEKLLNDFMSGENIMNEEVISRTSGDTFDNLEETVYKVESTGASISTGCSISLLYRYCAKLPRDMYGSFCHVYFVFSDLRV